MPFAPPRRRPTVPVRPCPLFLARRHPGTPPVLTGNTLPPSSHRRAAGEHATAPSHARSARGDQAGARVARALQRAAQVVFSAGLGCQVVAQSAFQLTAHSKPPRPVGCSLRPVSAQYCATVFKCFLIVLNSRNHFRLQKFIESCRNVQNLPNKFCMNPLEPLFTVGLTKLIFTQ
jgi:hypothetical protein